MSFEREIISRLCEGAYEVSIVVVDINDRQSRRTFEVEASNENEAVRKAKRLANPRNVRGVLLRDIRVTKLNK